MSGKRETASFGMWDKIGYLFGDLANDFTFILASMFLMKFYTNVMGISGAAVGTLFLISRVVDAFTDITMGRIVDTMKPAKDGRFRPWIKYMCGPVAVASFLMYQSGIAHMDTWVKMVYMYITYILWGSIFYTSINIPYGSMASAITEAPNERTSLSTFRGIGAALAGLMIGAAVPFLVYDRENNMIGSRMTMVAGIFSILAVICYLICYFCTTERVKIGKTEAAKRRSGKETAKVVLQNRALVGIIGAAIFLLLSQLLIQSMNQYLFPDYFHNAKASSAWTVFTTLCSLVIAPFAVKISAAYGKKETSAVGVMFTGGIYLLMYLFPIKSTWMFIGVSSVAFLGVNFFNLVIWANITDVIDYQEVLTGEREDGTVYAVYSFARKIGQALAGGLGGWVLTGIGYDHTKRLQSTEVIRGIYMSSTLLPAIFFLAVTVILMAVYPLNKKRVEENAAELKRRRN